MIFHGWRLIFKNKSFLLNDTISFQYLNESVFSQNLLSAKFLRKSVLPYSRRQIRRKCNEITAQKNIWVESDLDFSGVLILLHSSACLSDKAFWANLNTFLQKYKFADWMTVKILHSTVYTLRPEWSGDESCFISDE